MRQSDTILKLQRRKLRIRNRIFGTASRPRLNVYRSNRHIYAQMIDDISGRTLIAASSLESGLLNPLKSPAKVDAAKAVGQLLAERAKAARIEAVVFDRGGRLYHGRVKALAEASREGGLKF